MRYGIVGSRRREDQASVAGFIASLRLEDIVISGGCVGVDTWAATAARARGLQVIEHLPELTGCTQRWQFTRAHYARNARIASACDVLVAFVAPDRTGGTENTIQTAQRLGKQVILL